MNLALTAKKLEASGPIRAGMGACSRYQNTVRLTDQTRRIKAWDCPVWIAGNLLFHTFMPIAANIYPARHESRQRQSDT
jgi:hypothetical protein